MTQEADGKQRSAEIALTFGLTCVPIGLLLLFCYLGQRNAGGFHDEGVGWTELFIGVSWSVLFAPSLLDLYGRIFRQTPWHRWASSLLFAVLVATWPMTAFTLIEQLLCVAQPGALAWVLREDFPSTALITSLVWLALAVLDPILRAREPGRFLTSALLAGGVTLAYGTFWIWSLRYLFHGSDSPR